MRISRLIVWTALGWALPLTVDAGPAAQIQRRQDTTDTGFPALTTDSPTGSANTLAPESETATSAATTSTNDVQSSSSTASSTSAANSPSSSLSSTVQHSPSTTSILPTASSTTASNATASSDEQELDALPIQPQITPAFGIAGVFLIVLGATYALIGVKSRWVQIFLSCGFLASIATTALVDYVMNPPVTNAVQGGFFVAIFMTGVIFGGGALVFKEITEGFACLLGGFCFSMWLLTLRPGGLVTSSGGKGVFIGIFCITIWALSWTHYSRPYALIGAISFGGATAFTLGVDCFTRAGLKEFWFYLWDLNDDLFPLNTNTFPLTRGIKVENAIIVIGTIIGVLSQMKLWKVIRSKEREMEVVDEEYSRQREAVEAALGRHLQRQNEREKSEWEKQYGDRLASRRSTVLWQNTHPEKRYSSVSVIQLDQESKQGSSESLEMNAYGPRRTDSAYSSRNKRQSSLPVDVIEEVDEDAGALATERERALQALERTKTPLSMLERTHSRESLAGKSTAGASNDGGSAQGAAAIDPSRKLGDPSRLKRLSQQSLSRISKHLSVNYNGNSQSQEHLIDTERPHSRASSAAATLDVDNEDLDIHTIDVEMDKDMPSPPDIVISPARNSGPTFADEVLPNKDSIIRQGTPASSIGGNLERDHLILESDKLPKNEGTSSEGTPTPEESGTGELKNPQSHTSESSNSSADTLTKTALASVPSQLSSVVLSYRTNEWAKHITAAEEPVYDEPETIDGVDNELPTHLAPVSESEKGQLTPEVAGEIPPTATLPPTVKAGGGGVGIAAKPSVSQRSFSDQERRRSSGRAPSRSNSSQSLRHSSSRGNRTSLNPGMQHSLITTPIAEDAAMEFPNAKRSSRRVSAPYPMPSRSNSGPRPQTAYSISPYTSTQDLLDMPRPFTQHGSRPGLSNETRMGSQNSHQPPQRDLRTDAQRRESLLADWRLSQQQRAASTGISGAMAEQGRAQMRAEKENQKLAEEHQRNTIRQKQYAMDQMMRRPDMQELHREAMRKMQANANKKLRSSTG
ncbi:hypothetical protein A1O7_02760 [Cladophialophora yegresii CBS 114405]|uniref:TM7S3/TM198-like domain-containing protein n=1 Tax=Cladophialophora yegresii CBS 114405 TaxID=1182544 RepID=W9WCP0_9EURO|nr:uncharacterized protein A1O7_02760 [Cladophialophora yegresii CBS 114405]EXJ62326.1 hypothetical protein A1O7_02760 [Cladophialophora yegresii CBS 114405]